MNNTALKFIETTDFDYTTDEVEHLIYEFDKANDHLKGEASFQSSSMEVMGSIDGDYIVMFFNFEGNNISTREDIEVRKNESNELTYTFSSSFYNECTIKDNLTDCLSSIFGIASQLE